MALPPGFFIWQNKEEAFWLSSKGLNDTHLVVFNYAGRHQLNGIEAIAEHAEQNRR